MNEEKTSVKAIDPHLKMENPKEMGQKRRKSKERREAEDCPTDGAGIKGETSRISIETKEGVR